jgi:mannose-6-phosphate isomerase
MQKMSVVSEIGILKGVCKANSWGTPASASLISRFGASAVDVPREGPLAELWFGIHPKGTARFVDKNCGDEILLDQKLFSSVGRNELAYLAKILTVEHILSIQLHPDEETAKMLHAKRPGSYPDAHAKPEMAIALGDASLLCGVRPLDEIQHLLETHPGFRALDMCLVLTDEKSLKQGISSVLDIPGEKIELFYTAVLGQPSYSVYDSIARAAYEYLGCFDPGIVLLYFLSYVTLKKGDAVFIEPGIPHAYVSGDLFECMRCSDNVVRGGLTPKEIDKKVFSDLVQVSPYSPNLEPVRCEQSCRRYEPEGGAFVVIHADVKDESTHRWSMSRDTALFVCISGEGRICYEGESSLLEAGRAMFLLGEGKELEIQGKNLEGFLVFEK